MKANKEAEYKPYCKDRSQSTLGILGTMSKDEETEIKNSKDAQQILDECGLRRRKHNSSLAGRRAVNMTCS